ncbi:MAG: hypothetical protein J5923_03275 [Acidaminococcaceae bacterium]|nr:hypothetical protein [Acidaminococcaceae bacterium]
MKKNLSAVMTSLIVLGCAFPVLAAPKNVYTDADSGFSVQTANPLIEYASRHSYGFQENNSATDSFNSVVAIPAEVVTKKTGAPFSTKEFQEKLAAVMKSKSIANPDYALFRPETYQQTDSKAYHQTMEDALFDVFGAEELKDAKFSYETKTVGKQNYFVISMQYPGAFDKEKQIDKNASDIKLYVTSENNFLYLAESYCSAETEESKKAASAKKATEQKDSTLKKNYEEKGVSMETAGDAVQDPQALQKALLPLTDSSLSDPKFQKSLQKERDAVVKGLSFFKPDKTNLPFGMNDPVLKQQIPLPDNWLFVRATPDVKDLDGIKLNIAWAAPYTMLTNFATMCMNASDLTKVLKPEEVYNLYDESVFLASYDYKRSKNKNAKDIAEEIFSIPQSDMEKALNEMMPSLLKNENLKKYAVLSNTNAKITNDGKLIKFAMHSNVKVLDKYDFTTRGVLAGTRENGLFSLYVAKGDKAKTKSIVNLADSVKLLPK